MILRIRGDIRAEVEFSHSRIPSIAESYLHDGEWFRITNVVWAYQSGETGIGVWDVGIVVARSNAPVGITAKVGEAPGEDSVAAD